MSVLMSLVIFPTDKGSSVSEYVSKVVQMIDKSGFEYRLSPMATIVETQSMHECVEIIEKAYTILGTDCERVYITAAFDVRTNRPSGRLTAKIKSVESIIGRVKK